MASKDDLSDRVGEREFLRKLAALGIHKGAIQDLLGPSDYDRALPLILDHVFLIAGKTDRETIGLRNTLIRALRIPSAKHLPQLWPRLMALFHVALENELKWLIGYVLETVVKKANLSEVVGVLSERRHQGSRGRFCHMAKKLRSDQMVPPLLAMLQETRVMGDPPEFPYHVQLTPADPVCGLGYVGTKDVVPAIEPFLLDCYPGTATADDHVRTEAKRAIARILKRCNREV